MEFARSLPPGKIQDRAVANVIGAMAENDPRSAARLISSLPVEAQDDAAGAYQVWSSRPGRDTYAAYRAAQDRADAAQDALAAEGPR